MNDDEQRQLVKQLGRMRVYSFLFLLTLTLIQAIFEESEYGLAVLDDYIVVLVAVIAIIVIAAMWRKQTLQQLKMTNNILYLESSYFLPE